jgi:hypothetical protein
MSNTNSRKKESAVAMIARVYSIPLNQDFETLDRDTVSRIVAAANAVKYTEPRHAEQLRAMSFYALLNTRTSDCAPVIDMDDAKTVGEYFRARLGVAINDDQEQLRECPLDAPVGVNAQEVIDSAANFISMLKIAPDETGENEFQLIELANDLCLTLMYG